VNGSDNAVAVISAEKNKVIKKISVKKKPQNIVLSADGSLGYVTNYGSNSVSIVNLYKGKVLTNVIVGAGPDGVALSPDETRLYVANFSNNTVSIMDTQTRQVIKTVQVEQQPTKITFSENGAQAYVANSLTSSISVLNTSDFSLVTSLPVISGNSTDSQPDGVLLAFKGTRLCVSLFGGGVGQEVGIFSTLTNTQLGTVKVGTGPFAMVTVPPR